MYLTHAPQRRQSSSGAHSRIVPPGGNLSPECFVLPVHGELSHQCDVCSVLSGCVVVLQEVEVNAVNREPLPTEIIALIVFIQLLQSRLQLRAQHKAQTMAVYLTFCTALASLALVLRL